MTQARLTLEHIGKAWGRVVALSDICLKVPRGTFLSLLGRADAARQLCSV